MVGRIMVTSSDVYVGVSGMGIGRNVQCEMQFTIKRVYRNNLLALLVRVLLTFGLGMSWQGHVVSCVPCKDGNAKPVNHTDAFKRVK